MAEGKKLTKREKKAASFRQKQKGKVQEEPSAIPESDLVPDESTEQPKDDNKKRKVEEDQETQTKKKKTRRGKKKVEDGKRYIVFVGNLPYGATKEGLEKHFQSAGGIVSVRLMTDKETKKPKGFAFMEFESSIHLNKALAFHHTLFMKRQINVELTAGGGGKNEKRTEKLKIKNERLQEERQKAHQDKVLGKIPVVRSSSSYDTHSSTSEF
ncbi:uncharacterized protein BX664DRAFT_337372 [Halteromyces radiatus]|uniref:uncharacterized protein n=1 Tax=Halteromyces radiatus TaxID=101107 RepID=UPI00221EF496|nr:uncharacterized protein BX664DRAFT_337372 [Halteromyces radiatus]KAI8084607.1 hypothetical protein BX664DRAFT_337372 [Halteromyces radiatus]